MFAPKGFMPLNDIRITCFEAASRRFPEPDSFRVQEFHFVESARCKLYAEMLYYRFKHHNMLDLWIYQYPDVLLSAPAEIMWTPRVYDGPCDISEEEAKDALAFLAKNEVSFITDKGLLTLPEADNPVVVAYKLVEMVKALKPLEGSVVCWKTTLHKAFLNEAIDNFLDENYDKISLYGEPPELESLDSPEPIDRPERVGRGRPKIRDRAREAYMLAFPDGHSGYSTTQVEDRVQEITGQKIHYRTIMRGVRGTG